MNEFDIKNVGGKFIVTKNSVPVISVDTNKITEFSSKDDAQKYLNILQVLTRKKKQHSKV